MRMLAVIVSLALASCGDTVVLDSAEPTVGDCIQLSEARFLELSGGGENALDVELTPTGMKAHSGASSSLKLGSSDNAMQTELAAPNGSLARVEVEGKVAYLQAARDTDFVFNRLTYTCRSNGNK